MSAVVQARAASGAQVPLLADASATRCIAWRDGRAVDVAGFLADVGAIAAQLPAGSHLVNLCEDRYAFLVTFCAAASRGQVNLLAGSRAPAAILELLDAHPGSVAASEAPIAGVPTHVIAPLGANARGCAPPPLDAAQVAAIGFTSGSTGTPKAHAKTWGMFGASCAANLGALRACLPTGVEAHIVATVPAQHMYGIELSVLPPLFGAFAVHSGRPLLPADVAAALAQVPAPRILVTTPVHLRALLRSAVALPPLAAIVSATAPLEPALAAAAEAHCGAVLLEMFGSTETCVIAQRRTAHGEDWRLHEAVSLHPQPDGTLVEAPWFAAPVVLPDLVELLPQRRFRLCGRQADFVDIAGKRASLADLTRRVLALPGVVDAAVLQLDEPDAAGVRRVAALVVAPGRSEAELLAGLRDCIDPAFLPRPLRKVPALPRNDTGKLPRARLIAMLGARD